MLHWRELTCERTKLSKTWTQHVQRQEQQEPATEEEIMAKEASYDYYPCLFEQGGCTARFKTKHGIQIHAATCPFNYVNTSQYFEVEEV